MSRLQKIIIISLSAVLSIVLILIAIIYDGTKKNIVINDFIKPEFEDQVVVGSPKIPDEKLDYRKLELSDGFHISLCRNLSLRNSEVDVYFTSDKDNTVWTRIVFLDKMGVELGSSGLLRPGEYVESVALEKIPEKSGTIIAKILSYEPETYYSKGAASAEIYLNTN